MYEIQLSASLQHHREAEPADPIDYQFDRSSESFCSRVLPFREQQRCAHTVIAIGTLLLASMNCYAQSCQVPGHVNGLTMRLPWTTGEEHSASYSYCASHHQGYQVDFSMPEGTSVRAIAGGTVVQVGDYQGNCYDASSADPCAACPSPSLISAGGVFVKIQHTTAGGGHYNSAYLHLSKREVDCGDSVQQGELIGYSGDTGCSDGAHLHFHVRRANQSTCPTPSEPENVRPVPMVGQTVGTQSTVINEFVAHQLYRALDPPSSSASFSMRVINSHTGAAVPGVFVTWGPYSATTGNDGRFSFASVACGTHTLQFTKAGYIPYSEVYTPPCDGADQGERGCAPDAPCGGASLAGDNLAPRFQIGDVVQVAGTGGVGLRAWQNTCTGTYVVKPDASVGIIQDGPVCCGGHVRWKVLYVGESVARWSAEGDLDTDEFWLWSVISTHTISGAVIHNGAGMPGVVLQGLPGDPVTDADGRYSALAATQSDITVTPMMSGYTFSPASRSYHDLNSDRLNQDYSATTIVNSFAISGDISLGQTPFEGEVLFHTVPVVPDSPVHANDDYEITVPAGWTGTVTPVAAGYTFSPSSRSYTNIASNDSNEDYVASVIGPGDTTLTVNITPQEAIDDGGGWLLWYYLDGNWHGHQVTYRPSGDTARLDSQGADTFVIKFKPLEGQGWNNPPEQTIPYVPGSTQTVTATYTRMSGAVTATLSPPEAKSAGAQWRVAGGPWRDSGFTEQGVLAGFQVVEFKPVAGWLHPTNRTISVANYGSVILTDTYIDQGTEPFIVSVTPNSGPLEGGTEVTISGANFNEPAVVTFGDVPATQTTMVSETEIRAKTPPRPTLGSVDVAVTGAGTLVSKSNAFSYLHAVGHGMRLVGQIGGISKAVAIQGNFAYVSVGPTFVVSDVSNPAAPVRVGSLLLDGLINGITIVGPRAYVAAADRGVYIIDVSLPHTPALLGVYDTPGHANAVDELGGILYVADGTSGVHVLETADPTQPTLLSSVAGFGTAYRVDVAATLGGVFAYVTTYEGANLQAIDVTDPSLPILRGSLPIPNYATGVDVAGSLVYVVGRGTALYAVNTSDPDNLSVVGQSQSQPAYEDVVVVNNRAYTIGGNLIVFDISNLNNIHRLDFDTLPVSLGASRALAISGGRAYIANDTEGLAILEISTLPFTLLAAHTFSAMSPTAIVVKNGSAFLGLVNGGLGIVDVQNPAVPSLLSKFNTDGSVYDMAIIGTRLYAAENGYQVIDVSNPAAPSIRGSLHDGDVIYEGVSIANGRLYLAGASYDPSFHGTVDVYSLSNPEFPAFLGGAGFPQQDEDVLRIAVAPPFAYLALRKMGLRILDVSNANAPMVRGAYGMPNGATAVTLSGGVAYVGDNSGGLDAVNIANPDVPTFITSLPLPPGAYVPSLNATDGRLYVSAGSAGVRVYDIGIPAAPEYMADYNTAGAAYMTAVEGSLIYVADQLGGLSILELLDVQPPDIFITSPTFNSSFATSASTISIGGAASDDRGVERVTWINHRGGSGTAVGSASWDSWTVNGIPLKPGQNVITVTAYDEEGNAGNDVITVTYDAPPDTVAPSVTILAPTQGATYTTGASSIDLAGIADDDREVTQVTWTNHRGGSGNATGSSNWAITDIPLLTGENVLSVFAFDAANNSSSAALIVSVADVDQDAVADDDDTCPYTIAGVPVDADGCPPHVPGDADSDGDVDLADFAEFLACLFGPDVPNGDVSCVGLDYDSNQHIDLRDLAGLQDCFSSRNVPAACSD